MNKVSKYDIEVLKNEVFFFDDEKGFRVVDSQRVRKTSKKTGNEYKVRRLWVTADDENMLEIGTQSFNKKSFRKRLDKITTEWVYKKEPVEEQPTRYEIELTSVVEPVDEPVEVKEIERDEYVRKLVQENDFYGIHFAYKGIRDARDLINDFVLECLCVLDKYVTSDCGVRKEDFIEDTFDYVIKESNYFIDRTFKDTFKENEEEGRNWFATAYIQELRYLLQEKRLLEIIEEKVDEYIEDAKEEFPSIHVVEPDKYSKTFKNLTPKEAKRLMKKYAHELHPDLHPELDGSEFRKMYDAYEKHMSRVA